MKTSYILRGLHDPATSIEIKGSIYFVNNHHSRGYVVNAASIKQGRLCVYFAAENLPDSLMLPEEHYIKLMPNLGKVKLEIKEYEPNEHGKSHVVFYVVESMYTPASGDYFRYRKYEADLDWPFSDNVSCNFGGDYLVEHGFACTDETDDDGKSDFVFYRRKN